MAPFLADIDIGNGGNISFQVYTRTNGSEQLDSVSQIINDNRETFFSGTWMVVSQWREVARFAGFSAEVSVPNFVSVYTRRVCEFSPSSRITHLREC